MPTEIRHIIFSASELIEALGLYNRSRGVGMPSGTITEASPLDTPPGDPISFRVVVSCDSMAAAETRMANEARFDLSGPELTAALIGYCKSRGIPMPVRGSKLLQRFGSQIGLIITIKGHNSTLATKLAQG